MNMKPIERHSSSARFRPKTLAALAGLASVSLVLAACTSDAGSDNSSSNGGGSATEIRNAGVIVHAQNGEPQSLDPARAEQGEKGERFIDNVYERLVDVGPSGPDLIPSLATEIPTLENGLVSEDRLTYTFPLREGVVFHDGTDFTAEDVLYSWQRIITMNLPEGQAAALVDSVDSMRVVDDFTFEVTIQEP